MTYAPRVTCQERIECNFFPLQIPPNGRRRIFRDYQAQNVAFRKEVEAAATRKMCSHTERTTTSNACGRIRFQVALNTLRLFFRSTYKGAVKLDINARHLHPNTCLQNTEAALKRFNRKLP